MGQTGLLEILPYIYTVNDQLVAMATLTFSQEIVAVTI